MMPERSESYPYLALARRRGLDYGDVLYYADLMGNATDWNPHVLMAAQRLSAGDKAAIHDEYCAENERRKARSGQFEGGRHVHD